MVRVAWQGQSQQWDPHRTTNNSDLPPFFITYDRLLYLDENLELNPMLATEWELAADGSSYEISLRDDVTFHDGSALDATVVQQSLDRARAQESTVAGQLALIDSVTVVDATTIRLDLKDSGDPSLLLFQLASFAGMVVSPQAVGQDAIAAPAGSGPYVFDASGSSDLVQSFTRNDDYWDPEVAQAARIEIHTIADDAARLNALRAGEVDIVAARVTQYPEIESLAASGDFVIHSYDAVSPLGLYVNSGQAPFDDPRVRKAISMAIDREELDEGLMYGQCPPTDQIFTPGTVGHDPDLAVQEHDPAGARALLDEAGVAGNLTVQLMTQGPAPQGPMSQVLQQQLAAVGITAEITELPGAELKPVWRQGGHAFNTNTLISGVDPQLTVGLHLGLDNLGEVPADLQALIDAAQNLPLGSTERDAAYREISRYWVENPIHIPICAPLGIWLAAADVVNADKLPMSRVALYLDPRPLGKAAP